LLLTVFDRETLLPLDVLDAAGQVAGPNLTLGHVELTPPSHSLDVDGVSMQTRLDAGLGPLTLLGVDLDRHEAAPGDPLLITLFWRADGPSDADALPDLKVHLTLVDSSGAEAGAWELPPVRADWPTTRWEPGDLWRGHHLLRLPGALESGRYTWQLSLVESTHPSSRTTESPVQLGQLQVNAPERVWQAPPLDLVLDAELGALADLRGVNVEPVDAVSSGVQPPATLTVTLAWQARAEIDISYRVFLHLLRPDGSLLVQSDGEPAGWTRPTTGWAPGEVVLDERVLNIPADALPGQYPLVTGLYDPESKDRLHLADGTTTVPITVIAISQP
jgi:hypothetical protein